ncbi:MAG TPA: hypothetical protein VNJ05_00710 [Sphingomicrobium sp.]|nr:hypothetical protein [Sphingomicrobium sp.]
MSIKSLSIVTIWCTLSVGACSTAPTSQVQSPRAQSELAEALAGRTPGPAVRCIPSYRSNQMQVIDDYTILFRDGRTVYLQKPSGGCPGISSGGRTLVSRKFGTTDTCEGDINHIVDMPSGMHSGSCVFGPFVPYTKPR